MATSGLTSCNVGGHQNAPAPLGEEGPAREANGARPEESGQAHRDSQNARHRRGRGTRWRPSQGAGPAKSETNGDTFCFGKIPKQKLISKTDSLGVFLPRLGTRASLTGRPH